MDSDFEIEEFPNLTTFKFLITCEQSKDMWVSNLSIFQSTGGMMASIGTIKEYSENTQRYFSLECLETWAYYKKNFN